MLWKEQNTFLAYAQLCLRTLRPTDRCPYNPALPWQMLVGVLYMAFVMVIISTMLMIPFCLWALDLASNGWTGADVALFGATIASTDAASVAAILSAGVCVGRSAEHLGLAQQGAA